MGSKNWRSVLLSLSLITQVGLTVILSILVGIFLGRWLDGLLGWRGVLTILGTLLGIGAGFISAYRLMIKAVKGDDG